MFTSSTITDVEFYNDVLRLGNPPHELKIQSLDSLCFFRQIVNDKLDKTFFVFPRSLPSHVVRVGVKETIG